VISFKKGEVFLLEIINKKIKELSIDEPLNKEKIDLLNELTCELEKDLSVRQECKKFIGEQIISFYCNGFFGRRYDLTGSLILDVYETDGLKELKIRTKEHEIERTEFGYLPWSVVLGYLKDWTEY